MCAEDCCGPCLLASDRLQDNFPVAATTLEGPTHNESPQYVTLRTSGFAQDRRTPPRREEHPIQKFGSKSRLIGIDLQASHQPIISN
jgi:hypothetical protein